MPSGNPRRSTRGRWLRRTGQTELILGNGIIVQTYHSGRHRSCRRLCPAEARGSSDRYLHRLRAGLMRGSLSPAALRCVLSAADASLALDRFGIMPARSRVDILSTRLVFAPTVHGSAWPAAFGIIKRTDRAKGLSTTLLLRDSAHYLATPKPCRAAVEHNPIWQHRYGGVQGGSGTTVFTESLEKSGCPPSTPS